MINGIFDAIVRFFQQFVFWVIVEPWEQALRVRLGKSVRGLPPGVHLRIPYVDTVHKQSSRYRTAVCPSQTLTTSDNHTVVCSFAVGYALADIFKLYNTLFSANETIVTTVASFVSDKVANTARADLSAVHISQQLTEQLSTEFDKYGLKNVTIRLQDFAFIRAFRIIQDQRYSFDAGIQPGYSQ